MPETQAPFVYEHPGIVPSIESVARESPAVLAWLDARVAELEDFIKGDPEMVAAQYGDAVEAVAVLYREANAIRARLKG